MNDANLLKNCTDFKEINKFYLLFGPACNMQCRHCFQEPIKHKKMCQNTIKPEVRDLIGNYIQYIIQQKQSGIVVFWGGEPLLHWNLIQELITYYTNKFNLLNLNEQQGLVFGITTNGLLLNEEKINFLNKYRIKTSLSYDAPYPFAVRGKVPDKVCELAKTLKYFSTISTFNAINYDFFLAIRCLQKKFPNVPHRKNFGLIQTFDMPKDIYSFNLPSIEKAVKKLRIAASLGNEEAAHAFFNILMPLKFPKQNEGFRKNLIRNCCTGFTSYSITLNGDVISCHNSDEMIGTIEEETDKVNTNSRKVLLSRKSTECATCEHLDICTGKCTTTLQDENGRFQICNLFWKPFYTYIKNEAIHLNRQPTEEELSWFYEEWKKDDKIVENF